MLPSGSVAQERLGHEAGAELVLGAGYRVKPEVGHALPLGILSRRPRPGSGPRCRTTVSPTRQVSHPEREPENY